MTEHPGRSYKYYTGKPVFKFGFGLSYSNFTLNWTTQPSLVIHDNYTAEVTVKNTGTYDADEVVQVYFICKDCSERTSTIPARQLCAFQRVHIPAGSSIDVTFSIPREELQMVADDGRMYLSTHYTMVFSRGHGEDLSQQVTLA